MNAPRKIFVDADAFVALAREDDANHERAVSSLRYLIKQPTVFITSKYVFAESVTVISMHMGHAAAVRFIEAMQSDESIYLLQRTTDVIDEAAIQIFKEQTSKNTSFVDCTNMAFLKQFHMDAIFSFDGVYKKNGFVLVEDFLSARRQAA